MVVVLYGVLKGEKVGHYNIKEEEIVINRRWRRDRDYHEGIPEYCFIWCGLYHRALDKNYAERYHHDRFRQSGYRRVQAGSRIP